MCRIRRTWEQGYRPHWRKKSLLTWAASINKDNEHVVKKLAGKMHDTVTELDLRHAKELVRQYIVVGLTAEMEESIRRFNLIMGKQYETNDACRKCMDEFFGGTGGNGGGGGGMKIMNSNPHPMVRRFAL